jgi:hypothetical protein
VTERRLTGSDTTGNQKSRKETNYDIGTDVFPKWMKTKESILCAANNASGQAVSADAR